MTNQIPLKSIFLTFLKIGCLAFGGYVALMAIIEKEIVSRKKWLPSETLVDGMALTNLLPGPMAVNLVAFCGYHLRSILGAIFSVVAVLLPSFIMIVFLAHLYFNNLFDLENSSFFDGVALAISAMILTVGYEMSIKHKTNNSSILKIALSFILCFAFSLITPLFPFLIIILFGVLTILNQLLFSAQPAVIPNSRKYSLNISFPKLFILLLFIALTVFAYYFEFISEMAISFSTMSVTMFGGGYVFIPMAKGIVVEQNAWLSLSEYYDGVALGQMTPGPIMISVAFIGYKINGVWGALTATIAFFTPPSILIIMSAKIAEQLKTNGIYNQCLKNIRLAVIGIIIFTGVIMAKEYLYSNLNNSIQIAGLFLFILSLVLIAKFKISYLIVIPVLGSLALLINL